MSFSDGLRGEEEGVFVGVLQDAVATALMDSILLLGWHAGIKNIEITYLIVSLTMKSKT